MTTLILSYDTKWNVIDINCDISLAVIKGMRFYMIVCGEPASIQKSWYPMHTFFETILVHSAASVVNESS